ncbi:MAG: alpha/beta hydrolase [Rubrivivax sp.]
MLDPQARALIDLMIERRIPPVHTLTPAAARSAYRDRRGFTQPLPPEVADVTDHRTDSGLPLRLYRPLRSDAVEAATVDAEAAMLPVLVYFHGGGWTIGDLDTHDVLCRQLCAAAGVAVVSVDYRMGPEHRFPAAVDDCLASTRWVRQQAAELGVDGSRLAIGGDSAGGNLAAVVALLMRDAGDEAPRFQLLIYPATDMRAVAPSHTTNAQGYLLTADSIAYYRGHYIADESQWADWRASPLLAPDLSNLPPALVLTAGYDPLRDEGRQYADALSAAGTPCQYLCFERQVHGFITMGQVITEADTAVALCAAVLKTALQTVFPT